jgi:hypothetical protein
MPESIIDRLAEKLALLFNGGTWATHYTAAQKALWIARATVILEGRDWRNKAIKSGEV